MKQTTTLRKTERCHSCNQWHTSEVEVPAIDVGTEVFVVPNIENNSWDVTIDAKDRDILHSFEATDMPEVRYLIQHVAFNLHNHEKGLNVFFPTSEYQTHRRINSLSLNSFLDGQEEATKKIDTMFKKYRRQHNASRKLMMRGGV
tara:strand:- start:32 stop:466 length:435 start_codon:yes stop_codon:yes gene_type:complete